MNRIKLASALALTTSFGCTTDGFVDDATDPGGKSDTSVEAIFLDFAFDGEMFTDSQFGLQSQVEDQLLYTIGHLNGDNSVGRLDKVKLSQIKATPVSGGFRVTYHAVLPVAWGQKNNVPDTYTFELPRDVTFEGYEAFTEKYKDSCVDFAAHEVESGNMWYYYRTDAFNCDLDAQDVVELDADVSISPINTTGKFPEYHKVWEDGELRIIAIFGKFEDFTTTSSDAGIAAYNNFVKAAKAELAPFGVVSTPASIPTNPGVAVPDVELTAQIAPGKRVQINVLLVDNVRDVGPEFDARYGALSTSADMIAYNGHAGLGANVRALTRKGEWVQGQYLVLFMNGCDTYAYVDGAIGQAHAEINPDDPNGTKYVDIVTNAMPSFFHSMPGATMAMVRGLMKFKAPKTYEQMFLNIDSSEVVLVSGEQDNVFVPGTPL